MRTPPDVAPAPRLALIQMRVAPGRAARNRRQALGFIDQAASLGADMVLLPEALPLGWTHPSARSHAEPAGDGPFGQALREAAARHRVHVCSGFVERDPATNRIYNAALLVGPDGSVLLHHRKIHELDIARHLYAVGDRLGVTETRWGTLGVMICADAFAPGQVLSRSLASMGAGLILSPCAWAVPADHDNAVEPYGSLWLENYGPVAKSFGIWIAGASNVGPITEGPWKGRRCIGNSLVVDPSGRAVLQGPHGIDAETILWQTIRMPPHPPRGTS